MIRGQFWVALGLAIILSTGYLYSAYSVVCPIPLTYAVADVDPRFQLDESAAQEAVADAVAVWEDGLGIDIFTLQDNDQADVTVHFIFDERQARTEAEARERERLAVIEALSGEVKAKYEALATEVGAREAAYREKAEAYDIALARYNETVAAYNAEGGAPPEVFTELEVEANRLRTEAERLNRDNAEINALIDELNKLGTEANAIISRFNERVDEFNTTFADGREFTQGDYQAGEINIYSFADRDELHIVLVHELGHALGVEHVADPAAYMYYLLGEQSATQPLQLDDVAAFNDRCSPEARLATVPQPWRTVFGWLDA